jgi:hypothetical protein
MSGTLEPSPFYNDFRAIFSQNEEIFAPWFASALSGNVGCLPFHGRKWIAIAGEPKATLS